MNQLLRRTLALSMVLGASVASQAITFSNITFNVPPLSNGASFSTNANAISFFTPNALVGDPVHPLRGGLLQISYDADSFGQNMVASDVGVNLGAVAQGSGQVYFTETVYEIDGGGSIVGGPIGFVAHLFDANSGPTFNATIALSRGVDRLRSVKTFELTAPDTPDLDIAAVAIVNQSIQVVPEPATLLGMGLGLAALLRRRRR